MCVWYLYIYIRACVCVCLCDINILYIYIYIYKKFSEVIIASLPQKKQRNLFVSSPPASAKFNLISALSFNCKAAKRQLDNSCGFIPTAVFFTDLINAPSNWWEMLTLTVALLPMSRLVNRCVWGSWWSWFVHTFVAKCHVNIPSYSAFLVKKCHQKRAYLSPSFTNI